MKNISWEHDVKGGTAHWISLDRGRFLSSFASANIVKCLMHDVSVVSAGFLENEIVVFERFAGISVFNEKDGLFYGVYVAGASSEGPNYCIRQMKWGRNFKAIDDVLKGVASKSLFFKSQKLHKNDRDFMEKMNSLSGGENEVASKPSDEIFFLDKQVDYFIADDCKEIFCKYFGGRSTNPLIEGIFLRLDKLFVDLNECEENVPIDGSFRISYSAQKFIDVFGLK